MIKFEAVKSNFTQENNFIAQRVEKSYSNIFALASNLSYTKEESSESNQLGNKLISLF